MNAARRILLALAVAGLAAIGLSGVAPGGADGEDRVPAARSTAPGLRLTPVNFSDPPREYLTRQVRGWKLLVEKQLVDEDPELARRAVSKLQGHLAALFALLPENAHAGLRKLTLFLMYGVSSDAGGRNNGLEYFQPNAPRHHPHLDPRMASSILIYSARNYDWLPDRRALMALAHEFAHAYHLEHWPESQPDVYDAWEHARGRGLYRNVRSEDGSTLEQGYAAINHLEYFAELSAVYFVGGHCFPFSREELRGYDPRGYRMVEKMWGLGEEGPPPFTRPRLR